MMFDEHGFNDVLFLVCMDLFEVLDGCYLCWSEKSGCTSDSSHLVRLAFWKIQGTTILSYGSDINMMDAFSHCPIEKMIFR
jgi:hypothetical protein